MVAEAVDDFLVPRLGSGVRDYVDTGLFYLDHAIGCLSLAWPDTPRRAAALRFATSPASALPYDSRHPEASSAVTSLCRCLGQSGRGSREARNSVGPTRVPMPGAVLEIDSRAEVIPLLVTASAGAVAVRQVPGDAAMSLDDLTWAAQTADADSDLFMFCRALAASDRPQMIGFEAINMWEHWRRNGKTLFGGGIAPHLMQIELHAGSTEWKQAAQRAPLERALLAAGLPPTAAFDNGGQPTIE